MAATAPLILGHRGASVARPENTIEAFAHAIALGAVGIECDVQRTADGELVLIHDDTLDRTTNGTGVVGDLPWSALANLDAGGGRPIPRLADLFAWAHDAASRGPAPFLNLELKMPGVGPDTLAALAATRYPGPVALSSFDYPSLVETRHLDPSIELWYLNVAFTPDLIDKAHAIQATALALHHRAITPEVAAQVAAANLAISAWTVDLPADITRLLALTPPLRTLITNVPDVAVSVKG
ncbi:MAG: glycerophosphodiester phosphodiesterase family protein [Thermomicrobiales bacterium]